MMENRLFSVPHDMVGRNSITMEGIGSLITPNSLVQFDSFDLNNQNQALDGYTTLSALRGAPISDLHADSRSAIVDSGALVTCLGRNAARNAEFQEQFVSGTPISAPALTTAAASRSDLQENLTHFAISEPSLYPLEALRTYVSNDLSNGLNSSFASSMNYGCDEVFGNMNAKGDISRFITSVELGGKGPTKMGFQSYSSIGNLEPNSWISSNSMNLSADNAYGPCNFSNELSLSLATSQPSAINGTQISDQCSKISCSGITGNCLKESRVGSEQTSSSSKELSLSCGSYRMGQFSQVISGSRYLQVIQEILAQIASYSLENLDQMILSTGGVKMGANLSFSSSYPMEGGVCQMGDESPDLNNGFETQVDPALQKRAVEAKKTQLLTLLQVVDDRYNECLDEIHTVVSAFHAATELDPQIHTRFALQTISFLYKSLRERISNQILAMGTHVGSGGARDTEGSLESCYFQKRWTLQQLKKKDQLWRPQRGLPLRSVSVLRAWMFQNFLHPYPKDAEKHLLAVKSGLTRSQVSNWFINARVRLWKPMIEEMYAEMNKRNARQNEDGTSNHRNHISISNLRFNMN